MGMLGMTEGDSRVSTTTNRRGSPGHLQADFEVKSPWPAPSPASFYRPKLPMVFDISTPQAVGFNSATARHIPRETMDLLGEASADLSFVSGVMPDGISGTVTSAHAYDSTRAGPIADHAREDGVVQK